MTEEKKESEKEQGGNNRAESGQNLSNVSASVQGGNNRVPVGQDGIYISEQDISAGKRDSSGEIEQRQTDDSVETQEERNKAICQQLLIEFSKEYTYLRDYTEDTQKFAYVNEGLKSEKGRLDTVIRDFKEGAILTNETWKEIQDYKKELFYNIDEMLNNYKDGNYLEDRNDKVQIMVNVFKDEKNYEKFRSRGLGQDYLKSKAELEKFLEEREETRQMIGAVYESCSALKKSYKELENEYNKQKTKFGGRTK